VSIVPESSAASEVTGSGATAAAVLLSLIEDSGFSFAVIEDAVSHFKRHMVEIDLSDPAVAAVLRAHLLAVGSPTDVGKFFSLEMLCRINESSATKTCLEVTRLLAGLELSPDRSYLLERELFARLGSEGVKEAIPPLAAICAQDAGDISRAAARSAVKILGTRNIEEMRQALESLDLPEAARPAEMATAISRAYKRRRARHAASSRAIRLSDARLSPGDPELLKETATSRVSLRPERLKEKENRLRAILRRADRDPSLCGNCDIKGNTRVVHIIPDDRGGSERSGNLVALCRECWRRLESCRRDSSGIQRRMVQLSSDQMTLFDGT